MVRSRRLLATAALAVATAGCAEGGVVLAASHRSAAPAAPGATASPSPSPVSTVTVDGATVPYADGMTVADALAAADVVVRSGRYLAVVSGRRLGTDGIDGHVLADGTRRGLDAVLTPGASLSVVPGPDVVEPTRRVTVDIPAVQPTNVYVGGRPGTARLVVGVESGEVVSRRVVVPPVPGHLPAPGAVALTFDDGPSPTFTPQVLALLDRAHVHATFCLIGRSARAYPRLVRRIAASGHALCDHTWDHDLSLAARPARQVELDIVRGARAISAAAGVAAAFFRAPGGNWSTEIEELARAHGMTPLRWTVDPRDWSRPGTRTILATVMRELRPGGVVLLHDGGGDRSQTVAALRVLLRRLPRLGYHFVLPHAAG